MGEILSEKISNGIMNRPGRNVLNVKDINVVNLYTPSEINPDELEFIDVTEFEVKKYNVEVGDIFLTRSSLKAEGIAQANVLLVSGTFVFDDHVMRVKLKTEYDPFFVKEQLNQQCIKAQFVAKSKTGTMTTIGQDDITSSYGYFPSLPEQEKVATLLRSLDTTITLHQRKLDGLCELKKGYLQQMFPQADERVPRVRFAGFSDEWQERRLGDVVERVTRKNINLESTLPLTISAQYGLIDQNEFFDKQIASKDVSGYFLLKKGEFAYNKSYSNGYPWGVVKRLDRYEMGVLSPLYIIFVPTSVGSEFLLQYYETNHWHEEVAMRAAEGARNHGLLNITPSDFLDIVLMLPTNIEEQAAIGNFFLSVDTQITALYTKVERLKELKKAYLQKMFI